MKKPIIISILIIFVLYFIVVQRVTVNAGMEAVIVKKPWFSSKSGIEPKAISTGTIWAVKSTTIKLISLKPFEINEEFTDILTLENIPISFTMNMTFQKQKGKTPLLIEEFGEENEWYSTLILPSTKVSIESAIKSSTFQTLLDNTHGIQTLEKSASLYIQEVLKAKHIPINLLQFHLSQITPPKELITAAIETETLKQKAKSKEEKIKTEALRKQLEETRAKADKAYMLTMNMSVQQYLQMKKLDIEAKKISNQRFVIEQAKDSNGSIQVQMNMQ
jgi:hypothetical protein